MRNQKRELHPEYKGIRVCTDRCNGSVNYFAYYTKNRTNVGRQFDCVNKAVKWLDMQCVIQGIPQKNNTFKKV